MEEDRKGGESETTGVSCLAGGTQRMEGRRTGGIRSRGGEEPAKQHKDTRLRERLKASEKGATYISEKKIQQ